MARSARRKSFGWVLYTIYRRLDAWRPIYRTYPRGSKMSGFARSLSPGAGGPCATRAMVPSSLRAAAAAEDRSGRGRLLCSSSAGHRARRLVPVARRTIAAAALSAVRRPGRLAPHRSGAFRNTAFEERRREMLKTLDEDADAFDAFERSSAKRATARRSNGSSPSGTRPKAPKSRSDSAGRPCRSRRGASPMRNFAARPPSR